MPFQKTGHIMKTLEVAVCELQLFYRPFASTKGTHFHHTVDCFMSAFMSPLKAILKASSDIQSAKKDIFTACHSGKLKLTFTSPNIISTSPKNVLTSRWISQFYCNLNSSKKFTCPSGKLITEFTSPVAKSTSLGLSNTTFFARWIL